MGTPGDKANVGKVVRGEQQSQLDPEQPQQGTTTTTTASVTTTTTATTTPSSSTATTQAIIQPAPVSSVVHHLPYQPPPSTSSEMGLLSRLPQFEAFTTARPTMPPSSAATLAAAVKPEPPSSESFLGQAHMEDYYAHAKYYQPAISEALQTLYSSLPSTSKGRVRRLDEPGPSGLQPPAKTAEPPAAAASAAGQQQQPPPTPPQARPARGGTKRASARSGRGAAAGPSASSAAAAAAAASTSGTKKGSTACPVCHKSFATAEKLTKHQQVHSQAASPFKCEHCKKSFSSKFKLVRHALIHSDRKPFSCTVCERTFHRKDHLKNHIKVHSPSKKIYVCERPDCKKEYTSQMSYRKHQALHSAEEGSLQCQICSATFATKEDILFHLKVHAGSRTVKNPNEKKFTCDQCDRKFFTKKDVRRHLVVHTGMRDFLCQFCPQRFGRKDHLVRHIKKSHSKNVTVEEIETAIKTEGVAVVPAAAAGVSGLVGPGPGAGPGGGGGGIRTRIGLPETVVKPEQQELPEMMSSVKTEIGEFSEGSQSNPPPEEQFGWGSLEDVLEPGSFEDIALDPESYLPSTSGPAELKDLGGAILEDIEESEAPLAIGELNPELQVNPEQLQRLLEPSEEKNLPLPGFSQTFQSPPPPP